jgi:hypothetical protein
VTLSTQPRRQAWTDGSGFFTFNRVPPGKYQVTVWREREQIAETSIAVTAGRASGVRLTAE